MKKCFCDCCKKEIKGYSNGVGIPCHLWEFRGTVGYVSFDSDTDEMIPVSGRDNSIDLCSKCLNTAYEGMVSALLKENPKMIDEYMKNRKN